MLGCNGGGFDTTWCELSFDTSRNFSTGILDGVVIFDIPDTDSFLNETNAANKVFLYTRGTQIKEKSF